MPPRANNPTILPREYVDRTKAMLDEFGETALSNFATFWDIKYNKTVDFVSLNYDGGLFRFLRKHEHLFKMREDGDFWYVSNRGPSSSSSSGDSTKENQCSSRLDKFKAKLRPDIGLKVFNRDVFFWFGHSLKQLEQERQYTIPLSAYEHALEINYPVARRMIDYIRQVLNKFPEGIRSEEIYKYIPLRRAIEVFGIATSAIALVDELPELFYKTDSGRGHLVFDGHTHTVSDLTGQDDNHYISLNQDPRKIVAKAINEGLYQKTLLLIRQAGLNNGLKINVWRRAIKINFFGDDEEDFDSKMRIQPRSFFLALARFGLIELRYQGDIRNDLKAFLPLKPQLQFMKLKLELPDLINFDSTSETD